MFHLLTPNSYTVQTGLNPEYLITGINTDREFISSMKVLNCLLKRIYSQIYPALDF